MNIYSFMFNSGHAILHKKIPKYLPSKHVLSAADGRRLGWNDPECHFKVNPDIAVTPQTYGIISIEETIAWASERPDLAVMLKG